jgi:hypothetical protein
VNQAAGASALPTLKVPKAQKSHRYRNLPPFRPLDVQRAAHTLEQSKLKKSARNDEPSTWPYEKNTLYQVDVGGNEIPLPAIYPERRRRGLKFRHREAFKRRTWKVAGPFYETRLEQRANLAKRPRTILSAPIAPAPPVGRSMVAVQLSSVQN